MYKGAGDGRKNNPAFPLPPALKTKVYIEQSRLPLAKKRLPRKAGGRGNTHLVEAVELDVEPVVEHAGPDGHRGCRPRRQQHLGTDRRITVIAITTSISIGTTISITIIASATSPSSISNVHHQRISIRGADGKGKRRRDDTINQRLEMR